MHLRLSSQASHWAAFAGNALISVGVSPAYMVRLPPATHAAFWVLLCSDVLLVQQTSVSCMITTIAQLVPERFTLALDKQ